VDGRRGGDSDDGLFDEEEGEGMVGFEVDEGRRQELERVQQWNQTATRGD
jgi:hypothetical protein